MLSLKKPYTIVMIRVSFPYFSEVEPRPMRVPAEFLGQSYTHLNEPTENNKNIVVVIVRKCHHNVGHILKLDRFLLTFVES